MYSSLLPMMGGFNRSIRCIQFDSLEEFMDESPSKGENCMRILEDACDEKWDNYNEDDLIEWYGCSSKKELKQICSQGCPELTRQVMEGDFKAPPSKNIKSKKIRSDFGDELDIHSVYSGNLDKAWIKKSRQKGNKIRFIKIVAPIGNHCGITSEDLKWIGITTLTLCKTLQEAGYSVAIDIHHGAGDMSKKEDYYATFPVKKYGEYLDIMKLTSCVVFPGFYRHYSFMNRGLCQVPYKSLCGGMGTPQGRESLLAVYKHIIPSNNKEVTIFLSNDVLSQEAYIKAINKALKDINEING